MGQNKDSEAHAVTSSGTQRKPCRRPNRPHEDGWEHQGDQEILYVCRKIGDKYLPSEGWWVMKGGEPDEKQSYLS